MPFDAEKAKAWNSLWEQRYAPGYIARDDGKQFPKAKVRPLPVKVGSPGREPHSASVIRELEKQINGRVLSPLPGDE